MRHFGRGIVASPSNFGRSGMPPSHPELLDWLATEFVKNKWSIKHLHRLMLTSTAYQQCSKISDFGFRISDSTSARKANPQSAIRNPQLIDLHSSDPENALVSRMPLRRMEAEVVRDAVLAVAGELDTTPFGKPDPVEVRPDGLVTSKRGKNGWRRAIYVLHRRKEW